MKDRCVFCGKETPYDSDAHIDDRQYYVGGVGQLCEGCHRNISSSKELTLGFPRTLICPHCGAPNNGEGEVGVVQCRNCGRKFSNQN